MKNIAAARQIRRAMKSGKMPPGMGGGMPGMPPGMGMPGMGMPGMGMPGMGMPGMGMPGMGVPGGVDSAPRMRSLSKAEKNARKAERKRERTARKKNKGKK